MQQTALPLTDEEKANIQFLEITDDLVMGVADPDKLTKLTGSLVLPNGITEIGPFAFSTCRNLKRVIIESTVIKHIDETAFENVHADIHFTVKTDAVKAMLKKNAAIRDEHITVEPNMKLGSEAYDAANRTIKTGGVQ